MYEPRLRPRDRAATFAMVAGIHVALAFALINLSPPLREKLPEEVVEIFDVTEPPPPEEEWWSSNSSAAGGCAQEEEGAASAENIRSRATPVVAPKPPIQLPMPQPMPVTQTPNTGSERTQGASDRRRPRHRRGRGWNRHRQRRVGQRHRAAADRAGSRPAGGGPRHHQPRLSRRGRRYWPRGGAVFIAVRVLPNGRATDCKINRSIGIPAIDQWTCKLVEEASRLPPGDGRQRPAGRGLVRLCPAGGRAGADAGLLARAFRQGPGATREPRDDRSRMVGI